MRVRAAASPHPQPISGLAGEGNAPSMLSKLCELHGSGIGVVSFASNDSIAYNACMATLTIRNLPDAVYRKLRIRAAHAGRSLEAEAREILSGAGAPEEPRLSPAEFREAFLALYGRKPPKGLADELIELRRQEAKKERAR